MKSSIPHSSASDIIKFNFDNEKQINAELKIFISILYFEMHACE